jgi:hypothetical protein
MNKQSTKKLHSDDSLKEYKFVDFYVESITEAEKVLSTLKRLLLNILYSFQVKVF